jgi:hypothetical protein
MTPCRLLVASALLLLGDVHGTGTAAAWPAYRKLAKSDVPYSSMGARLPSATAAAAACSADPTCAGYNSDGQLKSHVGCEWGSDFCVYPAGAQDFVAADRVDLFVKNGAAPPAEWDAGRRAGTLLYAQPEPDICMMPEVGNGFVAGIIGFSSMHVSGFFNGGCGSVSKAHLPSVIGISATNANASLTQAGLDMTRGLYVRRLHLAGGGGVVVEQRTYAHRVRKHLLVTEFELLSGGDEASLQLSTLFDPLCGPPPPPPAPPPGPAFNGTYLKISEDSGGNGHDVGSLPECITGSCPAAKLKEACDANPKCDLFQTHGFLKRCAPDGSRSNATHACQPRTPWIGVDSYYKIRSPQSQPLPQPVRPARVRDQEADGKAAFGSGAPCGTAGDGCAGRFNRDIIFERVPNAERRQGVSVFMGNTTRTNESGARDTAVIVSRIVPSSLLLKKGVIERFMATVTTTVAMEPGYDVVAAAVAEYDDAVGASIAPQLLATHTAAWAQIWANGTIEVLPTTPPQPDTASTLQPDAGDDGVERGGATESGQRALDIQSHLYSSFYYLISSIRADWPHGALNPGGLASDNYDTVFFDMEFYMEPVRTQSLSLRQT